MTLKYQMDSRKRSFIIITPKTTLIVTGCTSASFEQGKKAGGNPLGLV